MPTGPQGQKRPADTVACAVTVAKLATGEITEGLPDPARRKAGQAGGASRADVLTPEERSEIARLAAQARWGKED